MNGQTYWLMKGKKGSSRQTNSLLCCGKKTRSRWLYNVHSRVQNGSAARYHAAFKLPPKPMKIPRNETHVRMPKEAGEVQGGGRVGVGETMGLGE